MADLQRRSYNLFDKNATDTSNGFVANHYLNIQGEEGDSINHNISEYIDISGYSTITIVGGSITTVSITNVFYDENKEKLSYFYTDTRPYTATVPNNAKYIRLTVAKSRVDEIMLISGSTAKPYEPYGWVHSLRKLCSATETIQSGDTIYANGQPISTYSLKGNTVQSGTPTPSNPVAVSGTGDRTENLYNIANVVENTFIKASTTGTPLGSEISNSEWSCSDYIEVLPNTEYTVNYPKYIFATSAGLVFYTSKSVSSAIEGVTTGTQGSKTYTFTTPNNCNYVRFSWSNQNGNETMFVTGGTAKPYEPYGYKIPISSANTTTPVYLGEVETTRQIKKLVLDGTENWSLYDSGDNRFFYTSIADSITRESSLPCTHGFTVMSITGSGNYIIRIYDSNSLYPTKDDFTDFLVDQYAAGTPVTVWYILATETTGTINEPLMKIGDYADTLSNATAIPTTDGANSITVDTTVQPSKFSATWTGWHDSSVQEYKGGVGNQKFDYQRTEGLLLQQYINQEGQAVENTSYNMSYLIPVTPNATYMWNFGSTVQHRAPTVAFYDSNGNYISVATHGSTTAFSFDTPINCAYVRVPIYISTKTAAMLNKGSTALPYEDYQYAWV